MSNTPPSKWTDRVLSVIRKDTSPPDASLGVGIVPRIHSLPSKAIPLAIRSPITGSPPGGRCGGGEWGSAPNIRVQRNKGNPIQMRAAIDRCAMPLLCAVVGIVNYTHYPGCTYPNQIH